MAGLARVQQHSWGSRRMWGMPWAYFKDKFSLISAEGEWTGTQRNDDAIVVNLRETDDNLAIKVFQRINNKLHGTPVTADTHPGGNPDTSFPAVLDASWKEGRFGRTYYNILTLR